MYANFTGPFYACTTIVPDSARCMRLDTGSIQIARSLSASDSCPHQFFEGCILLAN